MREADVFVHSPKLCQHTEGGTHTHQTDKQHEAVQVLKCSRCAAEGHLLIFVGFGHWYSVFCQMNKELIVLTVIICAQLDITYAYTLKNCSSQ